MPRQAIVAVIRIAAIAKKEWLLLLRNPHGLAALFLMPAIFVLVMSFTLKNTLTATIDLPLTGWVQESSDPFSVQWDKQWQSAHPGPRFASRAALQAALKAREIDAGIVVPANLTGPDGRPDSSQLQLWLGHRVQPAAAARLRAELSYSLLQAQTKRLAAQAGPFTGALLEGSSGDLQPAGGGPAIRYLYEIESGRKMTAVQQSVPAWLIFGMFFVVIPVAGVLIQERNEGTLARLATLGVPASALLGGKLLAFMLLNWVQLAFMLAVGHWLVPLLGGDALNLDIPVGWFALMVLATSAAAVGLALLIATFTHNFEHAAALGGGLNVVLAAIAGVMVPRVLMPPSLQTISAGSPMGWALDGMQAVFLGNPEPADVMPRAALLLGFALLCLLGSYWGLRRAPR